MESLPFDRIDPLIKSTLDEDFGNLGDLTTKSIVPPDIRGKGDLIARREGIIAGLTVVQRVFHLVDESISCDFKTADGRSVHPGERLGICTGPMHAILSGERTALNFLQHLSGVATLTSRFVEAVKGTGVRILDTRKTTPQLRLLEKYAVRMGGGTNHRFGLFDYILIKDNHIDAVGGITPAVERCVAFLKRMKKSVPIEVETRTMEEVEECLDLPIQRIMLDNFDTPTMVKAVTMIDGKKEVEASGNIDLERAREVAETGVNYMSVGALTHSVPALDISLIIDGE